MTKNKRNSLHIGEKMSIIEKNSNKITMSNTNDITSTKLGSSMKKIYKPIIITASILAVVFGGTLLYMKNKHIPLNSQGFSTIISSVTASIKSSTTFKEDDKTDQTSAKNEIMYDTSLYMQICTYKQYIAWCSKDTLKFTDKYGKELWTIPISVENPVIKCAGPFMVTADIGGQNLLVICDRQKKWSKKISGNILNVDINSNGYVCVTYEDSRSKTVVTLFDQQGKELFTVGKSDTFILAAKISPSNKNIAASIVDTSGIKVNSIIEFIDCNGKLIASKVPAENAIFPVMWYIEDNLTAIGDSLIVSFDKTKNIRWQKAVTSRILSSNVVNEKYVVVAQCKEKAAKDFIDYKSEIVVYTIKNGDVHGKYSLDSVVKQVSTYSDIIAANTGKEIFFLNSRGNLLKKYASKRDVCNIYFFDKTEVLLVTKGCVKVVKPF